jgi:hypothetical protein
MTSYFQTLSNSSIILTFNVIYFEIQKASQNNPSFYLNNKCDLGADVSDYIKLCEDVINLMSA